MAEPKKTRAPSAQQDPWWWGALIVALVCAASVLVFAPEATIDKLFGLLERMPAPAQLATVIGAIATAVAVIRNRGGGGPPAAALALLGCLGMGGMLVGCGASAIRYHAEGAAIATVAIEGAQGAYLRALDERMGACGDEACVLAVRAEMKPMETGLDVADSATRTWADAVRVALVAEESQSLLDALMVAALRVLARWADVRTIGEPYGLDLPPLELPAGLAALAGGGR